MTPPARGGRGGRGRGRGRGADRGRGRPPRRDGGQRGDDRGAYGRRDRDDRGGYGRDRDDRAGGHGRRGRDDRGGGYRGDRGGGYRGDRGGGYDREDRHGDHRDGRPLPQAALAKVYPPGELPTVAVRSSRGSPHPWIWKSMLARQTGRIEPGSAVRVLDRAGEFVATALYHPDVTIALRLLSRDPEEAIDAAFFADRFRRALTLRRDMLHLDEVTDAYRLVHGEADGLSGLIVDVLGPVVRAETYALGMARHRDLLRAGLQELFPDKQVVIRAESRTAEIEGYALAADPSDPASCEVREHGVRFHVDLRDGHKTGFFCDQRENRRFVAGLTRGRRVLDAHTYTGGFALYAACLGEAADVTGVDLDEKAVEVAKRNAKLNQVRIKFLQSDAFNYLRQIKDLSADQKPEVLVLDPPKLAHDRHEHDEALRAYGDLNYLGLEALADDAILATHSCSGVISEQDLLDALTRGAARANREVSVIRLSGAAADHPFALHAPEGRYLKAVVARVRKP